MTTSGKAAVGGFLILLAGIAFLHFAGTIRTVLGNAEATLRASEQLARAAFAGAITGITGITGAIVMIASAAMEGADADPVVSRAVTSAAAGPYFVAAMGFAVMLAAAGLLTLRHGVLARWTSLVALLGGAVLLHDVLRSYPGHQRRQRLRLRLSPGNLGTRDLVDCCKSRGISRTRRPLPATPVDFAMALPRR